MFGNTLSPISSQQFQSLVIVKFRYYVMVKNITTKPYGSVVLRSLIELMLLMKL